jgi:prolyl-tRNA synthetase
VELARRDTKEKNFVSLDGLTENIIGVLEQIQRSMFEKALSFREEKITRVDTWSEFENVLKEKGGFISAHWDGTAETEDLIKEKTKATIRCIPLDNPKESGKCILTGKPSEERVLFAIAY